MKPKLMNEKLIFNSQFIITSLGAYRLQPKGFANAQQAMDFTDNLVQKAKAVTEQICSHVIFYEVPDFTKAEQCTEEWLVAHQYNLTQMTLEEWDKFYLEFGLFI